MEILEQRALVSLLFFLFDLVARCRLLFFDAAVVVIARQGRGNLPLLGTKEVTYKM